jgi:hypothetical protein
MNADVILQLQDLLSLVASTRQDQSELRCQVSESHIVGMHLGVVARLTSGGSSVQV